MPGSATLGTNLVDSLLSVVDDLRGSLHTDMGVRQWRVFVRNRTWSGGRIGLGVANDVDVEILPQPLVSSDDRTYELSEIGLDESGTITISEVSLTYTESELVGSQDPGTETFYVLRDAHGQGLGDRVFQLREPPKPDRVQTIGWVIKLQLSADSEAGCPA